MYWSICSEGNAALTIDDHGALNQTARHREIEDASLACMKADGNADRKLNLNGLYRLFISPSFVRLDRAVASVVSPRCSPLRCHSQAPDPMPGLF